VAGPVLEGHGDSRENAKMTLQMKEQETRKFPKKRERYEGNMSKRRGLQNIQMDGEHKL
jgi:hypothetical protein